MECIYLTMSEVFRSTIDFVYHPPLRKLNMESIDHGIGLAEAWERAHGV